MKTLHVIKTAGIGGAERHLLELLPELAQRGIACEALVLAADGATVFTDALEQRAINVTAIPAGWDMSLRLVGRLFREIRSRDPDVVHTHLIHADVHGQLAARLARIGGVISVHGTHSFYVREPIRTAMRFAAGWAGRTIAISEHVQRFLVDAEIAAPERVRVVHYGISTEPWQVSHQMRSLVRSGLGLAPEETVLGIAARLIATKGHNVLIEAFASASSQAPLRLLVAGDGPLRRSLERMAKESVEPGRVAFLGHVTDMRRFMAACDIFVFPSSSEGFGLAVLEAMAAGLPVVASRTASLPELVVDRETGRLVDPSRPDELGRAIIELAADAELRQALGAAGRKRARKDFSLGKMASETIAVYAETTSRR